jgi:ATP synthase protein I
MNGTREEEEKQRRAEEADFAARLHRLDEQLDRRRTSWQSENKPVAAADSSAMANGLRLSAELVGGVVVGFILGWLFDRWLGTSPWGLIVFVLLGFAAGVLNVMRSAGVVQAGANSSGGDRRRD